MKKSFFTTACCVAALMSADYADADIILTDGDGNVTNAGQALTISGGNALLRTNDLTINADNGGGVVTFQGSNLFFAQIPNTTTIDIQAGEFNVTTPQVFLGNGGQIGQPGGGNNTFIVSGGDASFVNLGLGRDEGTGLLQISAGTVNVSENLELGVTGNADLGIGTVDFTLGSTGALTVGGNFTIPGLDENEEDIQVVVTFAEAFDAGFITVGGEAGDVGTFGEVFQVSGNTLSLIPEPASLALVGLGALAMAGRRRRA